MIENIFPEYIYSVKLKEWTDHKKDLVSHAEALKKEYRGTLFNDWNCDTFNTLDKKNFIGIPTDAVVEKLIVDIAKHVYNFAEGTGCDIDKVQVRCKDFWFNIAEPGAYQEFHQHNDSHYSAVFYVKCKKDSGNIVFKDLRSFSDLQIIPAMNADHIRYYCPEETQLLIFKSYLPHMVRKNQTDEDRISFAANYVIENNERSNHN